MAREEADLSELEREFELEIEDEPAGELEFEVDEEADEETSQLDEFESGDQTGEFAERFYELSQGSYETEFELDEDVNRLVGEMEQEFFFKGLGKRLKKAGRGLLKKGLKFAAGKIPALKALQGITQLARGNLKGMLASLAKAGLASAIPGGAVALPALKALGFEAEEPEGNQEAWRNYAEVSREAFQYLAENLTENVDTPTEASRASTAAFQAGLRRAQAAPTGRGSGAGTRRPRVIRLRRGERIVIKAV